MAEDVWQNLPFEYVMEDGLVPKFVFELKWPSLKGDWLAMEADDVDFWNTILEVCKPFTYDSLMHCRTKM